LAEGTLVVVKVIGGVIITIEYDPVVVPKLFVTVTLMSHVPVAVGVPDIFLPPDEERPGGRVPVSVHVDVVQAPPSHVAENVKL
jgi:hypothetical protein